MSDDLELIQKPEPANMGTVVLMLSLYLILLAFFILLNVISQDNPDKVEAAVDAVNQQFSLRMQGTGTSDDSAVNQPTYNTVSEKVKGMIETFLSLDNVQFIVEANNLKVILPVETIFEGDDLRLKPGMAPFLDHLAELLTTVRQGVEIDTEVMVYEDASQTEPTISELVGRRSALLVRALADRNVLPYTLTAAAAKSDAKASVVMNFKMRVVDGEQARRLLEDLGAAQLEAPATE